MVRITAVIFCCTFLFFSQAEATILDFEEFTPPSGSGMSVGSFESQGFSFTSVLEELSIMDNDNPFLPNTGSNTLHSSSDYYAGGPSVFELTYTEGTFDLLSLLALEGRNASLGSTFLKYSSTSIDLLGTFASGSTIATTLNLDLYAYENDLLDSQMFSFTGWTGLSSVQFAGVGGYEDGYSFGLDDITVNGIPATVPEPTTMLLFGTGLIGLAGFRRKKFMK